MLNMRFFMRQIPVILILVILMSCNSGSSEPDKDIISVTIAPLKYFVAEIAGEDIDVNIIVPPGSNPHNYEPYPEQITRLSKSLALISNGYMGFEEAWFSRFNEVNTKMINLSVGAGIEPISAHHDHDSRHEEKYDPHYWVSPKSAFIIAGSVRDLLITLYPEKKEKYNMNFKNLNERITELDRLADSLFRESTGNYFMIYHPNLAYIARDYGLNEIAVEFEGKEPPPSRFRELIDIAREKNIKTIFIQKEFDRKYAGSIAGETDAEVVVIDPLSENWYEAVKEIINELHRSFTENTQKNR